MKTYIDPEEVALMEKTTSNLRDRILIRLLFHLGCRISEALAVKVEDIDFANGTVTIEHLKTRLKLSCPNCSTQLGRNHSYCPKCGARVEKAVAEAREHRRMRTVPTDKTTLQMIQEYIQRGGPVLKEGKRLIFGINRHRAWQIIKECSEKAGLPKLLNPETGRIHNVSPHKLRDAFSVHAVKVDDSGDGLRLLQEQLGHQSITTSMRYRKVAGEELKTWYSKLFEREDGY